MTDSNQTRLTIAIPTFNRSKYLKELLPEMVTQCKNIESPRLEILVIDNASTDDTSTYIENNHGKNLIYIKNDVNLGADRNFLECIKKANGDYVWLFGDDEFLKPGGVQRVVDSLSDKPDLIIAESNFSINMKFNSYKNLLLYMHDSDPVFPVHHTLITKNVFLKSSFNLEAAYQNIKTNYSHMYGLIDSLKQAKKIIIFSEKNSAFGVREQRAAFADPPKNLEKKLVDLNFSIAKSIDYKRLKTDIWLYYNMRPIFNLMNSKKIRRLLKH